MNKYLQFFLKNGSTLEEGYAEAQSLGITELFTIECSEAVPLIGGMGKAPAVESLIHLRLDKAAMSVSWHSQAELFSPYYKDGMIRVPLKDFSSIDKTLSLHAGEGFGDLSHPTTRLVMHLLEKHVKEKAILDIGCGNGVLSFASYLLNAKVVCGIDIDIEALTLALRNRDHCGLLDVDIDAIPSQKILLEPEISALMNMTFHDQKIAWSSLKEISPKIHTIISSGILEEQKKEYLSWMSLEGFRADMITSEEGWLAFVLHR